LSTSWGSGDTLWFAVVSHAGLSGTITSVPTNYTDNASAFGTGANRVSIFSTDRNLTTATEDPGVYTRSSTGTSLSLTIAVRGPGVQVTSANSPIYAASSERLQGTVLSGVTNVLLTSGTRNVQTTVTSVDSGNVYFTVPPISTLVSSNIRFQSITLTANDSSGSSSIGSSLLPNTGYGIHDVTDTSQVGAPTCIYYGQVPSLVVGDQILYQSSNVSIDTQGFPTFSNNVTQFDYYIFDSTDETWGTVGTYYAQTRYSSRTLSLVNSPDGNRYSKYPTGNNFIYPYTVYINGSVSVGGLFDGASIPNQNATWRVITTRQSSRWEWYDGGGYTFDPNNPTTAPVGDYTGIYEVKDWDGQGNNATASITVSVS
jgi:hypothetical protein